MESWLDNLMMSSEGKMKAFVATLPLEYKKELILETEHFAKRLDQCVFLAAYDAGRNVLRIANPTAINSLSSYAGTIL